MATDTDSYAFFSLILKANERMTAAIIAILNHIMKLKFSIAAITCLTGLLVSCSSGAGEVEQKQHDIFPLPCKEKVGHWDYRAYYVDKDGKEIESISESLNQLDPNHNFEPAFFQDGLLNVDVRTPDGVNRVFIDEKGSIVIDMKQVLSKLGLQNQISIEYARYSDFSHGLCFVEAVNGNDLVYIAINKKGDVVFMLDYRPISAFNAKGQAYCKNNSGHIGIFSDKGEILVNPAEDIEDSGDASETLPPVEDAVIRRDNDGKFTLYSYSGKALTAAMPYRFIPDANDCCVVPASGHSGRYSIISKDGEVLCTTDFRRLENDGKWYWYETADREYGWIDRNGEVKIGPLKLKDSQSRHSRIDGFPNPFYGGEYSVGTATTVGEDRNYSYRGGCMSVALLQKMAEDGGFYELDGLDSGSASQPGVIMLSPMVNGLVIGQNSQTGRALVWKMKGKKLMPVNEEYEFIPAYGRNYIRFYGTYALNPGALWKGLR
ncbi:MAG: hypothetical protein K2I28_07485 [Muribaculaceae bacterium]|nr:hypothetical protein [Muribaculaceae bacterium]